MASPNFMDSLERCHDYLDARCISRASLNIASIRSHRNAEDTLRDPGYFDQAAAISLGERSNCKLIRDDTIPVATAVLEQMNVPTISSGSQLVHHRPRRLHGSSGFMRTSPKSIDLLATPSVIPPATDHEDFSDAFTILAKTESSRLANGCGLRK